MKRRTKIAVQILFLTSFLVLSALAAWRVSMFSRVNHLREAISDPEAVINHWTLIGPFRFAQSDLDTSKPNHSAAGLNHDYIADLGIPEEQLTSASLVSLCFMRGHCNYHSSNESDILFDHIFPHVTYAVVYAAAIIESTNETDAGLALGSSNGAKVWLNGSQLLATANDLTRSAFKNDDLVTVHLRQGRNLLLIKIDYKMNRGGASDPWALITSILSKEGMREEELHKADGHLLSARLLDRCDQFRLQGPAALGKEEMSLEVNNWAGDTQLKSKMKIEDSSRFTLPSLKDGFYTVNAGMRESLVHDSFYLGNYAELDSTFSRMHYTARKKSQEYIQGEPLIERYRVLTSPTYYHPSDADWQKKMLMVLEEETRAINNAHNALWTKMTGAHLREYISTVDNTRQDYWLYIPHTTMGKMPLITVMPYAEDPVRPFLESSLISWPDDLEAVERAAERNKVAVAIINGRGTVGPAPIGEADAFEVLKDISTNYTIDEKRLYLYGVCEGGRRALLLAEHYPGIFAAIGTYGPLLSDETGRVASDIERGYGNVSLSAQGLSSTAVFLIKGEYDEVSPVSEIISYRDRLRRLGIPVTLDIIPGGLHKQRELEARIFPSLIAIARPRPSSSVEDCFRRAVSKARIGLHEQHGSGPALTPSDLPIDKGLKQRM